MSISKIIVIYRPVKISKENEKNLKGIKIKKPSAIAEAMALLGSGKRSFLAI